MTTTSKSPNIIMTPDLFREFGIYVCDDQIINTYRYCPRKIAGLISGEFKVLDVEEGEKKKYFKSLVKGVKHVPRISRNKNGDKSTDELRIAERGTNNFVKLFKDGVVVNSLNVNMPLISFVGTYQGIKVWFEHTVDIFPTNVGNKITAIIPYLTSNVENTYFSPSFPDNCSHACWGDVRFINKVEALMILHLYKNFKLEHQVKKYPRDGRHELLFTPGWNLKYGDLEVRYIVEDLRPDKPGTVNHAELVYRQTPERFGLCDDIAFEAAKIYNAMCLHGFNSINQNETSCANCPLKCKTENKVKTM